MKASSLRASHVAFAGAALLAVACKSASPMCNANSACKIDEICRAARCSPLSQEPPVEAQRVVVSARDIAVVSPHGAEGSLPAEIPAGDPRAGTMLVLLRFPAPWGNRARIVGAFLTLRTVAEPADVSGVPSALRSSGDAARAPSAGRAAADVSIRSAYVTRIEEPWAASSVSWGRLPRLSKTTAIAPVESSLASPLRFDITSIVRGWSTGQDDQGLAVVIPPSVGGRSLAYATGALGGEGPRLDVYVR